MLRAAPDRLLLGFKQSGAVFAFDGDTATRVTTNPPGTPLFSGFVDDVGVLWLGGEDGQLFRGSLTDSALELTEISRSPFGRHEALAGFEQTIYSLGESAGEGQRIGIFDSAQWAQVALPSGVRVSGRAEIAIDDSADAFIAAPNLRNLIRIRSGTAALEDIGAQGLLTTIANLPGVGLVVGTDRGELFVRENAWRSVDAAPDLTGVESVAAFGAGFLYGGTSLGQYRPAERCPLVTTAAFTTLFIQPLGPDHIVLFGGTRRDGADEAPVVVLGPG